MAGMSDENVETIRRWYTAPQGGDPAPEMCAPEVEITNWAEFPTPALTTGMTGGPPSIDRAYRG
jgi:hypothetical protein